MSYINAASSHAQSQMDERDSNILRDVRVKLKTVADSYDMDPNDVVRVLLRALGVEQA